MANIPSDPPRAVSPLDDDDALPPGTRFGELEIIRVVGIGGFGIVYLAQDHALEREVALKEYMPGSLAGRGVGKQVSVRSEANTQTYALGLRSFVNEARLLARFNHPSLVKVYRFWEENGTAYMVMPFLQGRTLRDVRRSMSMAPDQAWIVSVMRPLLDALEQLHREAVYHRDIAPDNILLPPNELPVLLDFGAARRAISDRTQTFTAILKPSYAPIEQYADSVAMRQGPWTDVYALGAVVYYLLKGSPPPPATTRALHEDLPMLTGEAFPQVTPDFLAIVDWMLSIRPSDRPQSVGELREVLEGRATVPPRKPPAVKPGYEMTQRIARPVFEDPTQLVAPMQTLAPTRFEPSRPVELDPDATVVIRREAREDPVTMLVPRGTGTAGAAAAPRPPPARPTPPAPPSNSRRGLWLVMLACLLLLAALGALMLLADRAARRSEAAASSLPASAVVDTPVATIPADPPASAVASAADAASMPMVEVVEAPASEAASAVVFQPPAEPAPEVTAQSDAVEPAPPPDPLPSPPRSATPREKPAAASPVPRKPREARLARTSEQPAYNDAQRPAESTLSPNAVRGGEESVRPHATPPVAAQAPANPRDACGNRVFIAFDLCMEERCHEARYAGHAQCVRVREIEERRKRSNN